jgi:hypothetical protein
MIKNFVDKNNRMYNILMRGSLQDSIKSARKLKTMLDYSTSIEGLTKLHPSFTSDIIRKLHESYQKKTYIAIMDIFGCMSNSWYIGLKK